MVHEYIKRCGVLHRPPLVEADRNDGYHLETEPESQRGGHDTTPAVRDDRNLYPARIGRDAPSHVGTWIRRTNSLRTRDVVNRPCRSSGRRPEISTRCTGNDGEVPHTPSFRVERREGGEGVWLLRHASL